MLLINFTFRRLIRHWRLNLLILVVLTAATALVAALPSFATAVAIDGLEQALDSASTPSRNLEIIGPPANLNAGLFGKIEGVISDYISERVVTRNADEYAGPVIYTDLSIVGALAPESLTQVEYYDLWAFDRFHDYIQIVGGREPRYIQPQTVVEGMQPPKMEALIGLDTHRQTGLGIGNVLYTRGGASFEIVGVAAPIDPESEVWWDGVVNPFELIITPAGNFDIYTIPLIISPPTMRNLYPAHDKEWHILINREAITVDTALQAQDAFTRLKTLLLQNNVQLASGLPGILDTYMTQLSTAQRVILLLASQAFIFVLYLLSMITSFMLERSQGELATLTSRGASRGQIVRIFFLEGLILALPAGIWFGPWIAQQAVALWASLSGATVPSALPPEAQSYALGAAVFCWLALALPVIPAAQRNVLDWQQELTRPTQQAAWQQRYLDLFLLAFGGLAYWQLSQSGSFIMRRLGEDTQTDPFLLLGPSLMLIAVGLVFLRVFPLLLRGISWAIQQVRGLILPIGITRLARSPVAPSRVILLISITAALIFFAQVFSDTLDVRQEEIAHYAIGADLRVSLANADFDSLLDHPSVLAESRVFRTRMQTSGLGSDITLLAIDPATITQVTRYPEGVSPVSMEILANALNVRQESDPAYQDALPAIFSNPALPKDRPDTDVIMFSLFGWQNLYEIRGNIINFPTLRGKFILTNIHALSERINLDTRALELSHELWLSVDPAGYQALINDPRLEGRIIGDAQAQLAAMQMDSLSRGSKAAFELNALTLAVLSITGFILVQYFAARRRAFEFSLLRAMGISSVQLLGLLTMEGALVTGLGLLAGTGIGYTLAVVMRPFLSHTLRLALTGASSYQFWIEWSVRSRIQQINFPGAPVHNLVVDWPAIGSIYTILVSFFALALLFLLMALLRAGIHRALRIGEE